MRRYALPVLAGVLVTALASVSAGVGAATGEPGGAQGAPTVRAQDERHLGAYLVRGVKTKADVAALTSAGVDVEEIAGGQAVVSGGEAAIRRVRGLGYDVTVLREAGPTAKPSGPVTDFPRGYRGYHTYAEMVAAVDQAVASNPAIISKFSLGTSYEGRQIWAVKISDNVGVDEAEPEVLLTHGQHAREHLTIEQALFTMDLLVSSYGTDTRITDLVDTREIVLVLNVNPDGSEFDYATGKFVYWRKNRQPNVASPYVGTDLNRNWGYRWGCCGGSSGEPASEVYRGAAAFSAPETDLVAAYVDSRVVGGVQQITSTIDVHSFSELVLWPYGYTFDDVPADMTQDEHDVHAALGTAMASTNGYTPQQASDLYITDGTIGDWTFGTHRIVSFTFEMFPTKNPGFYPKDRAIAEQTARNKEAFLLLLEYADCPYRIIGKQAQYCVA